MSFSIEDHRLQGPGVIHLDTPNRYASAMTPDVVVEHYTAGTTKPSVNWLIDPAAKASAHLVIDGEKIFQLAPFNVGTWHAGVRKWSKRGRRGINRRSIGIEHVNYGLLERRGGKWHAWWSEHNGAKPFVVDDTDVVVDGTGNGWHAWNPTVIEQSLRIHEVLIATYPIRELAGHSAIDPDRKIDPGPFFPWHRFRSLLGAGRDDEDDRFIVTASFLNVRSGPGTGFPTVREPLDRGTVVVVLECVDGWCRIDPDWTNVMPGDEAWVYGRYLTTAD